MEPTDANPAGSPARTVEDHPFRAASWRRCKPWSELDALGNFLANLFALGLGHADLQGVKSLAVLARSTRAMASRDGSLRRPSSPMKAIDTVGVPCASRYSCFAQQLIQLQGAWNLARINHHVIFIVDHALEIAGGHVHAPGQCARGMHLKNQMCETGTASSMWPMRSRRTRASVTSTPQRSQTTPLDA